MINLFGFGPCCIVSYYVRKFLPFFQATVVKILNILIFAGTFPHNLQTAR